MCGHRPRCSAVTDVLSPGTVKPLSIADLVTLTDAQNIFNGVITTMLDAIYTGRIAQGWTGDIADVDSGDIFSEGVEDAGSIASPVKGDLVLVGSGIHEEDDQE